MIHDVESYLYILCLCYCLCSQAWLTCPSRRFLSTLSPHHVLDTFHMYFPCNLVNPKAPGCSISACCRIQRINQLEVIKINLNFYLCLSKNIKGDPTQNSFSVSIMPPCFHKLFPCPHLLHTCFCIIELGWEGGKRHVRSCLVGWGGRVYGFGFSALELWTLYCNYLYVASIT